MIGSCECVTPITFDVAAFRTAFPAFSNSITFTDATLQMYFNSASDFISTCSYGPLNGTSRVDALNLMTAHLTALSVMIAAGQTPYLMNNANIDKVTVGLTPPPLKNEFEWWLMTTPYGMQLLALLQTKAVGGRYIGGSPQLSAFRNVGGYFGPGWW